MVTGTPDLTTRFGGYFHREVPGEDAELSHVGPDTPCGKYFRRFWLAVRFTHTIDMDWPLPGVRPTGQKAELIVAVFVQFAGGKIAHEHVYWDHATALSQLGVLDHPLATGGIRSAAELLRLR